MLQNLSIKVYSHKAYLLPVRLYLAGCVVRLYDSHRTPLTKIHRVSIYNCTISIDDPYAMVANRIVIKGKYNVKPYLQAQYNCMPARVYIVALLTLITCHPI